MRYLGGKARQAKKIKEVIARLREGRNRYIEPFVGGGSVFAEVAPAFKSAAASDIVEDLALFWGAVAKGWRPPETLTREEWLSLKAAPPSALRAWAGFAASYNGKWFAGYGPRASGRDYLAESYRALCRKAPSFEGREIYHRSYADIRASAQDVVYCDIPYKGTETYQGAPPFEHIAFWRWAEEQSLRGALVLVHEYEAPAGWEVVSSAPRTETMNHASVSSGKRAENLYKWN